MTDGGELMDKNILIVDDEKGSLDVICQCVEREGYTVHCASKVVDALEIFDAVNPFLVVTDLKLQNHIDGATMADRMHRKQPLCIFVAISGLIDAFEIGYLLGAVFTDVLQKPFEHAVLKTIVNYAWEKRQRWETILTA